MMHGQKNTSNYTTVNLAKRPIVPQGKVTVHPAEETRGETHNQLLYKFKAVRQSWVIQFTAHAQAITDVS